MRNLVAALFTSRCKRAAAPETQLAGGMLQHDKAACKADVDSSLHWGTGLLGQAQDPSSAVLPRRAVICSG